MTFENRPPRLTMVRLDTQDEMEVQFNPTSFSAAVQVSYQKQTILGMSHQQLQYTHTQNTQIPLDLRVIVDGSDRLEGPGFRGPNFTDLSSDAPGTTNRLGRARACERFLSALCYPRAAANTVRTGAPPRVLIVWPRVVSLQCVVTAYTTEFLRFNRQADPVVIRHQVTLEEARDVRLTAEDVLRDGWRRSPLPPDLEDLI